MVNREKTCRLRMPWRHAGTTVPQAGLNTIYDSRLTIHGRHQRTFNVAKPINTSTTLMIQNRTITRGSGQPFNSK